MRKTCFIAILLLILTASVTSSAQSRRESRRASAKKDAVAAVMAGEKVELPDTLSAEQADSLAAVRDSLHHSDSTFRADSLALLHKSSLDRPAFTAAKDSIIEVNDGRRILYYYGDVSVSYGSMKLSADYMEYDLENNTLYARGTKDPATGEVKGQPVMEDGGKSYKMEELRYNFKTRKARITNMITTEEEGIIQGKNIKMMPDNSINMTKGRYTVCDCEHPHYYLALTAAKVITKPSQKTVFGPAYPVIEDVPLPIGLPFGFIPKRPDRATGLLMPTFGEETARGFYLRDLGMYFVIGDYFDVSITGDLYTLGSWSVDVNSRYRVNYKCNGSFGLTYSNDQTGEKGSTDFFQTKNFSLKWSHSQDAKARPGTSFSASVNFSSPSNSKYNSHSVNEALQNQISSSISYSRNWNGKFNLSMNVLHNQNSRDSSYTFTLPNVTFSVSRFYPFKKKNRVGKEKFYEKFSLGYSTAFQNKLSFKVSDFQAVVLDPETGMPVIDPETGYRQKAFSKDSLFTKLPDKLISGMNHNFQIGLPSFTLFKYLNFSPSLSYGMNWHFSKGERHLEDALDKDGNPVMVTDADGNQVNAKTVVTDPGKAFNTFGATHTYSGSISMSTRLYGLFNFGKHHKVQAIRHVVTPSLSFSYSPEKGTRFNGWRTLEGYYDAGGKWHEPSDYNIYNISTHNTASAPGKGQTGSLSFSLGNNFEAKVRDLRDTTGTGTKKVKLLDQLNLNGSYNFLADSLRLSNIGITASTTLFNKISISANLNFDPYAVNERGVKYNKFAVTQHQGLLRLTNAGASLSYSISGEGKTKSNDGSEGNTSGYNRIYYHPVTGEYIPGGYLYYINTNAPWSLSFNYSYSYRRSYQYTNNQLITRHQHTQTLGFNGSVKITPAFSIQMSSGLDLMAMKLTTTQISATYDLHCFNISVSWVPTGAWQSWSFRIAANAAALADLLQYKKSSSYWDN